jgi:hypothetical protein
VSELHTVEAFVVDDIKDEQLPGDIPGCPLKAAARRLIMAEVPVAVTDPELDSVDNLWLTIPFTEPRPINGYQAPDYELVQTSSGHVRSLELHGPALSERWQDEHGNIYTSINLKGINFSRPGVMEHPTAVDQYVGWGMQESKIIGRVIRATKEMRARGIPTENIIGLSEPKEFPMPQIDETTAAYTTVPLHEYRRRIVDNLLAAIAGRRADHREDG